MGGRSFHLWQGPGVVTGGAGDGVEQIFPMVPTIAIAPAQARFAAYRDVAERERRAIRRDNALRLLPGLATRLR